MGKALDILIRVIGGAVYEVCIHMPHPHTNRIYPSQHQPKAVEGSIGERGVYYRVVGNSKKESVKVNGKTFKRKPLLLVADKFKAHDYLTTFEAVVTSDRRVRTVAQVWDLGSRVWSSRQFRGGFKGWHHSSLLGGGASRR